MLNKKFGRLVDRMDVDLVLIVIPFEKVGREGKERERTLGDGPSRNIYGASKRG